jgi:hypothetical protein
MRLLEALGSNFVGTQAIQADDFVVVFCSSTQMPGQLSFRQQPLPSKTFPVHHSSVVLPLEATVLQ